MFCALLTFYRTFYVVTASVSATSFLFLQQSNVLASIIILFWMKIITNLLIGFLFGTFKSESLYFYNNLGYSSLKMYLGVFFLDIFIWLLMGSIVIFAL